MANYVYVELTLTEVVECEVIVFTGIECSMDVTGTNHSSDRVSEHRNASHLGVPFLAVFNTRPVRVLLCASEYIGQCAYHLLEAPCRRVLASYRLYPCDQLYGNPQFSAQEVFPVDVWMRLIKKLDESSLKSLGRVDTSLHTLTLRARLDAHYQKIFGDNPDLPVLNSARREKLLSHLKANGVPDRVAELAGAEPVRYWGLFRACGQFDLKQEDVLPPTGEPGPDVDSGRFYMAHFLADNTVIAWNFKKHVLLDPEDLSVFDVDRLIGCESYLYPLKDNRVMTLSKYTGEINVFLKQEGMKLTHQKTIKGAGKVISIPHMFSNDYVVMLTEADKLVACNISTGHLSILKTASFSTEILSSVSNDYMFVVEQNDGVPLRYHVSVFHRSKDKIRVVKTYVSDETLSNYTPVNEHFVAALLYPRSIVVVELKKTGMPTQALNCDEPISGLVALPNEGLAGMSLNDYKVYIWRLAEGEEVSPEPIRIIYHPENIGDIFCTLERMIDGRIIRLGCDGRTLTVIDPASGAKFLTVIKNSKVNWIEASYDGRLMLRRKDNKGFFLCDLFSCPPEPEHQKTEKEKED